MKKYLSLLSLLIVIKLYSGGIMIGSYEIKKVPLVGATGRIIFTDINTGKSYTYSGTYLVELND